eukprot:gene1033-9937_t
MNKDEAEINLSFQQLSVQLFEQIKADKDLNDQTLSQLYFLYKDLSLEALMILDKGALTKFVGKPSKISYFQVVGQNAKHNCISETYCSCKNFIFSVVNKNETSLV